MPLTCKGICGPIAHHQDRLKKDLFKNMKQGRRPRQMNISTISKYCKSCDERFYFVDYIYCKCCGGKMRSRNVHNSLGDLDKDMSQWLGPLTFHALAAQQTPATPS